MFYIDLLCIALFNELQSQFLLSLISCLTACSIKIWADTDHFSSLAVGMTLATCWSFWQTRTYPQKKVISLNSWGCIFLQFMMLRWEEIKYYPLFCQSILYIYPHWWPFLPQRQKCHWYTVVCSNNLFLCCQDSICNASSDWLDSFHFHKVEVSLTHALILHVSVMFVIRSDRQFWLTPWDSALVMDS